MKRSSVCSLLLLLALGGVRAADTLEVNVLDTEGGKAVIVVSPGGETMLIDAGYPTADDRDTNRIVAAARSLGIARFDFIVATHYDLDHAGNIPQVDARIPGRVFVDHGEILPTATARGQREFYERYLAAIGSRERLVVKPGDTIPLRGVRVTVVSSGGAVLRESLPGAGQPNELGAGVIPEPLDVYDNAGSIGLLFEFGRFRMLDLADLLQTVECRLMVPVNRVGRVDLFMVSHHGYGVSNSRLLVHALHAKAAIMNNGPRKGGEPRVFDILRSAPGAPDLWQLHASPAAGDRNAPADFIANPDAPCGAQWISVSAQRDGTFTVTNSRNHFARTYQP
jgi:competence protein ComEC